jgi:hypothetical protein
VDAGLLNRDIVLEDDVVFVPGCEADCARRRPRLRGLFTIEGVVVDRGLRLQE